MGYVLAVALVISASLAAEDSVNEAALARMTLVIVAIFVYHAAMCDAMLPREPLQQPRS